MAGAPQFPAFLKIKHEPDSSAKASFIAEVRSMAMSAKTEFDGSFSAIDRTVANTLGTAEQRFRQFSAEAQRQLSAAVTSMNKGGSGIDIGAGAARANAAAAQSRAAAAREIAAATRIAASEAGDFSQQTRLAIAATEALAREEQQAAAAALSHARAVEQVQGVLARQAGASAAATSAAHRMVAVNDNVTGSLGQQRAGLQQLGMQINDVATMWSLGARPAQIFASQIGQVTQAVQLMAGGTSRLAGFLGGPWGIALSTATILLAPFIGKLFESKKAIEGVEFSSYQLGDAQSILGGAIDATTGKVRNQSAAFMALARAQALAGQIKARAAMAESRESMTDMSTGWLARIGLKGDRGLLGQAGKEGDILEAFQEGSLSPTEAERGLRSFLASGRITEKVYLDAAKAVTDFAVAAENLKAFEGVERMLTGKGTAADRSLLLKPDKPSPRTNSGAAARAAEGLAEYGRDTSARLADIGRGFDDTPAAVGRVADALAKVSDISDDIKAKLKSGLDPKVAEELQKQIAALEPTIRNGLNKPFDDFMKSASERAQIDKLLLSGRENEAEAMRITLGLGRDMKSLTDEQRQAVLGVVQAERQRSEELQRQQAVIGSYLDATRSIRGEIEAMFAGEGKPSNFKKIFKQLNARILTEQLFGDALRGVEDYVKRDTFKPAVDDLTKQTHRAGDAFSGVADVIDKVRSDIERRSPSSGFAANDNGGPGADAWRSFLGDFDAEFNSGNGVVDPATGDIIVNAARGKGDNPPLDSMLFQLRRSSLGLNPAEFAAMLGKAITSPLSSALNTALGPGLASSLSGLLSNVFGGYMVGGAPGGVVGGLLSLFGSGVSQTGLNGGGLGGGGIGGLFGASGISSGMGAFGAAVAANQMIGDVFGFKGGPLGIFTGLFGGLFKKKKYATATIGGVDGALGITGTRGNSGSRRDASGELGGAVLSSIDRIAEALGADVDPSKGSVSVGMYKKDWRVSTTGYKGKLDGKGKSAIGLLNFGDDQEGAMRAATLELIKDGVLTGLKDSTQRLLRQGKDLDAALQKAVDFESVFTRLKGYKDPVGAAIDVLDKEFTRLKSIFKDAGASTAEYAQLEELYGIERANAVKEAAERWTSSLKGLLDDLTIGDSGLSLRDRQANARLQFDPLAARVAAGDTSAFDAYAEAAQALLEITHQIEGSQKGYFDLFDAVKATTGKAIADQENVAMIAQNRDSPFSATPAPADNASVVSAIRQQTDAQTAWLETINANLATLVRQTQLTSVSGGAVGFARLSGQGAY